MWTISALNKVTHVRYDMDYLPEAEGKGQASHWARLNC